MNFDKIIKDLRAEKPEDIEEILEIEEDIKTFTMLKNIKTKKVKTRRDFEKAFEALCYGSPSFCCDTNKPCLHRNAVLNALGISIKDFIMIKMKWHKEFMERFVKDGK